jgi:lipoprotein-releasing system permease protein
MDTRFVLTDLRQVQKLNDWTTSQVSGIEILIDDYAQLNAMGEQVHQNTPYTLKAETIKELYPNIFEWLALSDTNAIVLLIITIIVCIITMTSTFFIIILEQTKNIGILKTMGLNHKRIVKLFLIIASRLIVRGLVWGNIIALVTGVLQITLHLIPLDPASYYVAYIPMVIHPLTLLWVNVLVFSVCLLALLLPAYYISKKISPIDAIRFEG